MLVMERLQVERSECYVASSTVGSCFVFKLRPLQPYTKVAAYLKIMKSFRGLSNFLFLLYSTSYAILIISCVAAAVLRQN